MIGGLDILIKSRAGKSSLEVAVRAIRQQWPQAVFEDAISGDGYTQFREVPFSKIEEIFVYRDAEAADSWEEFGAIPKLCNTMVHLLADADAITVVFDEQNDETSAILDAVSSGLNDPILYLEAA